jgi:hypothetical protein
MTRNNREIETRTHEMREVYDTEYTSPLAIPPGVKKDGYSYRWVNTGIKGAENHRVEEMAAKGWTVVKADRAPGFSFDPLGRNPLNQQFICYKDVILMERPEEYCKNATRVFNKFNDDRIKSLRGVSNDIGSFSKPLNSINSF